METSYLQTLGKKLVSHKQIIKTIHNQLTKNQAKSSNCTPLL